MISTLYEPFRHWSDGGSAYILPDLHFADDDGLFMDSGWITPQEQLSIINGIVMKNNTFICLGDVGRLFKHSTKCGINSAEFIKVYMKSATSKALDKQTVELAFDIFKHKIKEKWHLKNVLERAIIFITEGHELLLTRHCSLVFTLIYASESW